MANIGFLNRLGPQLRPDSARVIIRPFRPAVEPRNLKPTDKTRANHIVDRVVALAPEEAERQLAEILANFDQRHRGLVELFEARAVEMESAFNEHSDFTTDQRRLIGAFFLHEYSFEASALFNPSIVLHPDQVDCTFGTCRFILSLRAVGEGHISSLTFRTGTIGVDGTVAIDDKSMLAAIPAVRSRVPGQLGDDVTVGFDSATDISERVIFPLTDAQSNGIEDARFVRLDDDGHMRYLATYTAYNGREIRSELIETPDFVDFRLTPLHGYAARTKGMALFPRKFGDKYAMIARQDNENLHLIYSNDLYFWEGGTAILQPRYFWEFVQIGNCGSPVELDEGWLLLTHGVGAIRKYTIGAVLLDKADPSIVLARSREPLIRPEPFEREGYVPNVVYTCGLIKHGADLVIPYAVSDTFTNFATIPIRELLTTLEPV
jgi:predicted GH43/DUF377 family glycosyl hydrolase